MMSMTSLPLILLVLLPFAGAFVAACLPNGSRNRPAIAAGAFTLLALLFAISQFGRLDAGEVLQSRHSWLPMFGLDIIIRMDGLAWLFSIMVLGIGLLVILYARYYMSKRDPVARFYAYMLAFMGSMMGVVLSGNLIQLVVFWELTSLTSFLLIGYWQESNDARRGAPPPAACACWPACSRSAISSAATSSRRCWRPATRSAPMRCTCRRWC
jgi:multicomponent K+:H+ antiporter subunit A